MDVIDRTSESAALGSFCLARLRRFAGGLAAVEESGVWPWRRFTRRALLVAYHDCVAVGRRAEADEVLEAALDVLPAEGRALILLARASVAEGLPEEIQAAG
ncbi:MAG TPA: hypothetical protein VG370_21000 [Chloroflexota bacterium]|jgi:hypothetical protein|nr:hypothetical protein [Chloroflexota bacterium]